MSLTSTQLIAWVRQLVREANANAYSAANVRGFLNLVMDEVWEVVFTSAMDKGWLVERTTAAAGDIDLVADQDNYSFPTGYVLITGMKVKDGNGDYLPLGKWDQDAHVPGLTAVDTPTHYTLFKDDFLLSPPPSTARTDGLRIYGVKSTTHFDGTADETSGMPAMCDRILALGASKWILEAEGSPLAGPMAGNYEKALLNLPSLLNRRDGESFDPEVDATPRNRYPGGESIDV